MTPRPRKISRECKNTERLSHFDTRIPQLSVLAVIGKPSQLDVLVRGPCRINNGQNKNFQTWSCGVLVKLTGIATHH